MPIVGALGVESNDMTAAAGRVANALAMLDVAVACPFTEAKADWLSVLQGATEPLEQLVTDLKE